MFSHRLLRLSSLALSLVAFAFVMTSVCGAQASKDSKEFSGLLSDVKTEAVQLRHDADELKSFTRSKLSWESQSRKVEEIRQHVNTAGALLSKLENARETASPWQQQAIDRITPLLKELASNVSSTIEHLKEKPGLFHTSPYIEYVAANYDLASNLEELISDYVEYGSSKERAEELRTKLDAPGA